MGDDALRKLVYRSKYRVIRRHVPAYYRAAIARERWSPGQLDGWNWEMRLALLAHAYERSPFYKRKYADAGMHPEDIKTREHWATIPPLTRDEIASSSGEILNMDPKSKFLIKSTTGGTTGSPITTCRDWRLPREALAWRTMRWWGIDPAGNAAYVWRMRIKKGLRTAVNNLLWWPTVKLRYDSSSMTPEGVAQFIDDFNKLRPPLLQGYTGAIAHIAMIINESSIKVHQPKAIWVTSSPLSNVQRNEIERAFGAPVYDQYGSCETTHISAQCAQRGALHIHHDAVGIEIVDPQGTPLPVGEHGRILVTDLENLAFPMIRYINGDEGRLLPGKCACGISLPLMDKVAGRVADHLPLPGGAYLAGEYLTTIFDGVPDAVRQFQVRQAKDHSITVSYVPRLEHKGWAKEVAGVEQALSAKINGQAELTMERCETIPHDRGKLRFVISEVDRGEVISS